MTTSHTKGPWKISKHCSTSVMSADGRRHVCSTGGFSTNNPNEDYIAENEANAGLIASAPELLEALAELVQLQPTGLNSALHQPLILAIAKSAEAIAKARGEKELAA